MSIIYDALKKAQESIRPGSKQGANIKPSNSAPKFKAIFLYILVVCLGLAIGTMVFSFLSVSSVKPAAKQAEQLPMPMLAAKEKPTPPPAPVINPSPAPKPDKQFILNGVFFSQNEGYALINNQIVRKGDSIDEAVVLHIGLDGVELDSGGKTVKITKSR